MCQDLQVNPVAAARGPRTPRSIAAGADPHYPADRLYWPHMTPALHECEPHGRWLAKNCVAFFNISLSSFRTRFSRRSRSFSRAKSACGAATRSLGRYCDPLTRQATGQRNPHRLPPELFCMLDHLAGLLERALCSQATGAKPVQVHIDAEIEDMLRRRFARHRSVRGLMRALESVLAVLIRIASRPTH